MRFLILTLACLLSWPSIAQEPTDPVDETAPAESTQPAFDPEATHEALRAVRDSLIDSWEQRELEAMLEHVHPEAVVTWQNGHTARGHDEIRAFTEQMLSGDSSVLEDMSSELEVDTLSILHGEDTAIAYGSLHDHMTFRGGKTMDLESRWTATLVFHEDRWMLASWQLTANLFDNPVLAGQRRLATFGLIAIALLGLAIGIFIGARRRA